MCVHSDESMRWSVYSRVHEKITPLSHAHPKCTEEKGLQIND